MAMGTRKHRQRQEGLWYRSELPEAPGHPFYQRLNQLLDKAGFDEFCESRCRKFYHEKLGRPLLEPGMCFRLMLIGFFEGIDSERGIGWRVADSLCLRQFLQIGLDEPTPDHVTISRTRRLMDEATHQEVFGWVLQGGIAERQNDRHRRDDAGGQCGHEVDRATRHAGELHGLPEAFGGSRRTGTGRRSG